MPNLASGYGQQTIDKSMSVTPASGSEWTKVFSTALASKLIVSAAPARIRSASGRVDATAATGTYYIHCWNLADVPANATAVTAGNALMAPVKVSHVSGTDDAFALDFMGECVRGTVGITLGLSTTEFTQTAAGAYLSATVEYGS